MDEYVKTATGGIYNTTHCGSMNSLLYITVVGYSIVDIATVFSQQKETEHIEHYVNNEIFNSYDGFISLTDISILDDEIQIVLKNPSLE